MRALLLKDLRVLRPWWWLILPGQALFAANAIFSPEVFFGMNVVLALALTAVLLIIEWKQEADRFVGSLPVSRTDVVRARYLWALGVALGGTALYGLYGRVLLDFGTERLLQRWPVEPAWESPEGLLVFFVAVWLVSVAYLPFYFRSGLAKGTWLFTATAALSIVGGVGLTRWWPVPWTGVSEGAGSAAAVVAVLLLALALGALSLRLSIRFYDRREF